MVFVGCVPSCSGDAGGLCSRCSPADSPRAACLCDSGERQRVAGRKRLPLSHAPLGPTIGFAPQEALQRALGGSSMWCCDSNAVPGAPTAVLLLPGPAVTSPVPTCLSTPLRVAPTGCGKGPASVGTALRGAGSDPVPWSPRGVLPLARMGELGLAGGQAGGEASSWALKGKYRGKLPLRVETQGKTLRSQPPLRRDCPG